MSLWIDEPTLLRVVASSDQNPVAYTRDTGHIRYPDALWWKKIELPGVLPGPEKFI